MIYVALFGLIGLLIASRRWKAPAAPQEPTARPSERLTPGRKIDSARLRASWVDRARKAGAL